ncbi:MAG: dihydroorotate dehydrogenase electron transfer subunit [Prolixibacteraceae bacterium]|nr:dihydroorotate dehydrogenase electron transfer subunit [Prolixibacteraceae bacterium]
MAKKYVDDFTVIEKRSLNSTNYLIKLLSPGMLPEIKPGQFVNISVNNCSDVFLRRPFSVFEVDYSSNTISVIIKILGRGSRRLTQINRGDSLNIMYPLGKGFTFPRADEKILLTGGGSGVAPMLFLARESGLPVGNVDIIIGARTLREHINVDEYSEYGNIHFTTEDGSLGVSGLITEHPLIVEKLSHYNKIYSCGPGPMMKAVAKKARQAGIFCEVSLENMMACGFGVCLCCIEPTVKGNLCVCTEGPVFNINDLKWEI